MSSPDLVDSSPLQDVQHTMPPHLDSDEEEEAPPPPPSVNRVPSHCRCAASQPDRSSLIWASLCVCVPNNSGAFEGALPPPPADEDAAPPPPSFLSDDEEEQDGGDDVAAAAAAASSPREESLSMSSTSTSSAAPSMTSRPSAAKPPPPLPMDNGVSSPPPPPPAEASAAASAPSATSPLAAGSPSPSVSPFSPAHASPASAVSSPLTSPTGASASERSARLAAALATNQPSSAASAAAASSHDECPISPEPSSASVISLSSASDQFNSAKSFAGSLTHNFTGVAAQVEIGAYATKRAAAFLKKLALAQEEYARQVSKLLAHEQTKLSRLSHDGMKLSAKSWAAFLELFGRLAKSHATEASEVLAQAAAPLTDSYIGLEVSRKEILVEERKCSLEMSKARAEVSKALAHTVKLLDDARAAVSGEDEKKKPGAHKGAAGFFKTLAAAVGKKPSELIKEASKSSQTYSLALAAANKRQEKYVSSDLPRLFNDMQMLERRRLDTAKARLGNFARVSSLHCAERAEVLKTLTTSLSAMDAKQDIAAFIQDQVWEHGQPVAPTPFSYDLPCTPVDIEAGRLEGNPNSIFRSTLSHCMELQKSDPQSAKLDVPRILPALITRIKELGGYAELGIFRISVSKEELDGIRRQIDEGNYNLQNIRNPHCCAALLKEWVRLLLEPVIPSEALYQQAIESVGAKPLPPPGGVTPASMQQPAPAAALTPAQSTAAVKRVLDSLPPLNQRVLKELSLMARDISTPEMAEKSKMTTDNLAIVFAPSFLRCPSEDPSVLMSNSKFETKFTVALFKLLGDITW
jgi:hypothetical protein